MRGDKCDEGVDVRGIVFREGNDTRHARQQTVLPWRTYSTA